MAATTKTVTVAKGNTLSSIAAANKTTVAAIAKANPQISNVNVIKPGQVINIPGATAAASAKSAIPAAAATAPAAATAGITQAQMDAAVAAAAAKAQADAEAQYQQQLSALTAQQTLTAQQAQQAASSDAFAAFRAKFDAIGMSSLADALLSKVTAPDAPTNASGWYSALLATPEYKTRFGDTNAMRLKNGLPMLTEGEILTAEKNIGDTLRNAGMPAGFYDQPQDFQQFIAYDKSAAEVGSIVNAYQDMAKQIDPNIRASLQTYYGLNDAAIASYLMDPAKAQPVLNAITAKGTTAAAAASAGIQDIAGAAQVAGGLGAGTLDYAKQAQAFAQAQQLNQQVSPLSNIYGKQLGSTYSTAQGLQEAFQGPEQVQAQQQRQRLAAMETAQFGGSAGASQQAQSLGIGTAQGSS
jgi:LysM repeat protein